MSVDKSEIENTSEINNCQACSANPKNWRICVITWIRWFKDWTLGLKKGTNEIFRNASILILIVLLSVAIILIAKGTCGYIFWNDPSAMLNWTLFVDGDADIANTKATLLGVFANVILTSSLIVVTLLYATDTHAMLKQSRDKQRIEHIIQCLERFYMPVKNILEDSQYVYSGNFDGHKVINQRNYDENLKKFNEYFILPDPATKFSPQAILYHVQAIELKGIDLYKYFAKDLTSDCFVKVTSMKTYNDNLKTYKEKENFDGLLGLVESDFVELSKHVNDDIKSYKKELDQLTANPP